MVSSESSAAMQAARDAVKEFMIKNGHHDTTVHEVVRPAIYHETVSRTDHEIDETVISREIHQDHFHASIQPITDSETLEEQHVAQVLPVETKTFEHDDREEVQSRLDSEMSKFRSHTEHVEGEKTNEVVPVQAGEHYHHHVREVIVPVVNRHVIQPHIVHKIVQIHEVHHQAAKHHLTSALPAVTMAEFKKQGGILTGREERYDWLEGEPRSVGGNVGTVNTAISGSPAVPSSQGGHSQAVQGSGGATETRDHLAPQAQTASSSGAQAPPYPVPERRSTIPSASQQTQAAPSQQTQAPSQSNVPTVNAPESSNAPNAPSAPTQPSAAPSTIASRLTGATSEAPSANPGAGSAHPGPGRWSLLPMHFARSDGDAARAGQTQGQAHPPTRAAAARPQVAGAARPSSAGAPPAQQAPSRYPGDNK